MNFLKIKLKFKGVYDKLKDFFKKRKLIKKSELKAPSQLNTEFEEYKKKEFDQDPLERPRRILSPSARINREGVLKDQKTQDTGRSIDSEPIDLDEVKSNKKAKIRRKALVQLNLSDGSIELKLPVLEFPSLEEFKDAAPINCEIKVKDINDTIINQSIELRENNCRIESLVEKPILLKLNLFKSIRCEIQSSNSDLNKIYKYTNKNELVFIFLELKENNPYIDDLNKFFNANDYFWILAGEKINIKPSSLRSSSYVAYDKYKLQCIYLNQNTNEFQIINSDDIILDEVYKLPQINLAPKEGGYIIDKFFEKEPIFSKSFSVIVKCSELLDKYIKVLHIQSSRQMGKEIYHKIINLKKNNQIEITPIILDNRVGNFQINLEFFKNESQKDKVLDIPIRTYFRFCPISIDATEKIVLPTSENYLEYPLLIQNFGKEEINVICEDLGITKILKSDRTSGYDLVAVVPINKDEVDLLINSEEDSVHILFNVPRIKWRFKGLKKYSKFSGLLSIINYEEISTNQDDIILEIKSWLRTEVKKCSLNFKDETFSLTKLKRNGFIYSLSLDMIYDKMERYLNSVDDFFLSLTYKNHTFPILKIISNEKPKERKITAKVKDPYVELDFIEKRANLVIPEQVIKVQNPLKAIDYQIKINSQEINSRVHITQIDKNHLRVERKEFEITEPLTKFNIEFPKEFDKYHLFQKYQHKDTKFYLFKRKLKNKAKMEYLWDEKGILIPIPKKHLLILHKENLDLTQEPDSIEDLRIWDYERIKYIDLTEENYLIFKDVVNNCELQFPCECDFFLSGNFILDDYSKRSPLFIGRTIIISSPIINQEGWEVWIKNRSFGIRLVNDFWTGKAPIILSCPDELGAESGEFQINIKKKESRRSKILHFRYIQNIEIRCANELIIPQENGHDKEVFEVVLGQNYKEWDLNAPHNVGQIINEDENGFNLILDKFVDSVKFTVMKKGQPISAIKIQITIPRLKWKLGGHVEWTGELIELERRKMINSGKNLTFEVKTNDLKNLYNIKGILKAVGESTPILEVPLHKLKGDIYQCGITILFETLRKNIEKLTFSLEILNSTENSNVIKVNCLYFPKINEPIFDEIKSNEIIDLLSSTEEDQTEIQNGENITGESELVEIGIDESQQEEFKPEEIIVDGDKSEQEEFKPEETIVESEQVEFKPEETKIDKDKSEQDLSRIKYEEIIVDEDKTDQVIPELVHEVLRDNSENICIKYAVYNLKNKKKCKIEAHGNCKTRAVHISEILRNFYFKDKLHYESICFNTKIIGRRRVTGIEISLNIRSDQDDLESLVPNDDIGMYVGHKRQEIYLNRAWEVIGQQGYCKILSRGRLISKTATICERLKNVSNGNIIYDDIILYLDKDVGNIIALYVKISDQTFKIRQELNSKLKIGKTFQIGNSVFEL